MPEPKISRCGVCGGRPDMKSNPVGSERIGHWVECSQCLRRGPSRKTLREAVAEWNRINTPEHLERGGQRQDELLFEMRELARVAKSIRDELRMLNARQEAAEASAATRRGMGMP